MTLLSLWMPILLSAVIVFVVSSIIHMLLGYHKSDFVGVPDEDGVMDVLQPFDIPPGDYVIPHAKSSKDMQSPAFKEKQEKGPVIFMTVLPKGTQSMGLSMLLWFLYSVIVGIFAAYIASRAVGPDGYYLSVFRFVGCTAFVGYSLALLQGSIWYKRKWSSTIKSMFDGLIYALLTAGVFGWLWP